MDRLGKGCDLLPPQCPSDPPNCQVESFGFEMRSQVRPSGMNKPHLNPEFCCNEASEFYIKSAIAVALLIGEWMIVGCGSYNDITTRYGLIKYRFSCVDRVEKKEE